MTIFLSESDVVDLLDMPGAIDALEKGFKEKSAGTAVNFPECVQKQMELV